MTVHNSIQHDSMADFFEKNAAVMLLVNPQTGVIVDANPAAAAFYGFPTSSLKTMNISSINTDTPEIIKIKRQEALSRKTSFFQMQHRLSNGTIKSVRVHSSPVRYNDETLLLSIIHDETDERLLEDSFKRSQRIYKALFEVMPLGAVITDMDGKIMAFNHEMNRLSPEVGTTTLLSELDIFKKSSLSLKKLIESPQGSSVVTNLNGNDSKWFSIRQQSICDGSGKPSEFLWLVTDITDRTTAVAKLELSASVFVHAKEGIIITDNERHIIDVNDAFKSITQYSKDEVIGKTPSFLKSELNPKNFHETMWNAIHTQGFWHGEVVNLKKDGTPYSEMLTISTIKNDQGVVQHYVGVFSDISDMKEYESKLEFVAHYDDLTKLPNRLHLSETLHEMIERESKNKICVIYIDLDGFKEVNDRFGHGIGDELIKVVATRIGTKIAPKDFFARVGGDEFVIVLDEADDTSASYENIERVMDAINEQVDIEGHSITISASIGATFWPQHDPLDADQLLRQADQAMCQSKLAGKNQYQIFDEIYAAAIKGLHESNDRIRKAIRENEFVLHYQPKANMRTGKIIGAEALIRWNHPQMGFLYPDSFLPLIEGTDISVELGEWVIENALKQMSSWAKTEFDIAVSVNVSGKQLLQHDFMDKLDSLLKAYPEVSPSKLELEVLESSALSDIDKVSQVISNCSKIGVHVSLDDFGTGYSSLTYLKMLPAETLKIDKSFVFGMLDDPDDLSILEGVIGLAQAFRRKTIAEGVETAKHGLILMHLGCDLAQGYGIAKPMPAEKLQEWVKNWVPPAAWTSHAQNDESILEGVIAVVEHRAWMKMLCDKAENGVFMDGSECGSQCRFGKWIANELAQQQDSVLADISSKHDFMHEIAKDVCKNGKNSEKYEEMKSVSEEIIRMTEAFIDSRLTH